MKLVEVMACVDRVAKNGTNETQRYKYAMASDVYDAVRSELARRFVMMVPHLQKVEWADIPTKSGGTLKLCTAHVRFDFTDAETGEVLPVEAFGQGSDSGDKAGYKAMTGATKQCLIQTFLIPTGDDPEHEPKAAKLPAPAGLASVKAQMPQAAPPANPQQRDHQTTQRTNGNATHNREMEYPFGSSKGKPIRLVDDKGIAFWLTRCEEELRDASKAKWHDKTRERIATLQAEQRYRMAEATASAVASTPPPGDDPSMDEPPPLTDDDAPH